MNNPVSCTSYTIYYLLILFVFSSCNADRTKKVDISEFDFATTDASELYFKNIRESYYHIEEKDGVKIYRLKAYDNIDNSSLRPMIVYHWRSDKAFLMLEFSSDIDSEHVSIVVGDEEKYFQINQIRDHLIMANELYDAIIDEKDIFLNQEGQPRPLWKDISEKSNFSLVLYDFFRLTNVY